MKILVLGSEGFIGSHCTDHFLSEGYDVFGLDLYEQSTKNYHYIKVSRLSPEFDEIFQHHLFDVVVNAAGSGNVSYSMLHPLSDFESNCLDTIRILDALRKHRSDCKYIHLSSAAVYGNPVRLPVQEGDPTSPMSPYGWHKLIAEKLCSEYTRLFNLRTAIIRPFSVYGPGLKKQLFWDLYQKSNNSKARVELFGTGKESRDFIHVSDLVKAIDSIIHNAEMKGEQYNLASGAETTIEKAVSIFFRKLGRHADYYFNGHVREGDPLNWRADTTKLNALGFSTGIDLTTGLTGLTAWMTSLDKSAE